jgi:nanoRNase/pAp phosphatase (c-di-AMP/oligoRNAs hydrolase)
VPIEEDERGLSDPVINVDHHPVEETKERDEIPSANNVVKVLYSP